MPTDDKSKRPIGPDPNPTSNVPDAVRQTLPTPDERPQEHQHYHYRTGEPDVAGRGRDVTAGVRDVAEELSETADDVQELVNEVGTWIRQQTDVRPMAVTAGAFAVGYVIGGGLPRWLVRFAARVGLPMAAVGAFARYVSTAGVESPHENPLIVHP